MRRIVVPELLDTDSGTPGEIASSLADLDRINRWFGGTSGTGAILRRISQQSGQRHLRVLDVAAGDGSLVKQVRAGLARDGIRIDATLVDRSAIHMQTSESCVAAEATALPFADGSFDIVLSNLFLHHLDPADIVRFATEGLRIARLAFAASDVERTPAHLALVYAGVPLFRSRLTRHDAIASVKRGYTRSELRQILESAKPSALEISRHYLQRLGVIAWR